MIVGCQGVINSVLVEGGAEFEIILKQPFEPRAISIAEPGNVNILSFRLGPLELVHDRNSIDGRTFVQLFPQELTSSRASCLTASSWRMASRSTQTSTT